MAIGVRLNALYERDDTSVSSASDGEMYSGDESDREAPHVSHQTVLSGDERRSGPNHTDEAAHFVQPTAEGDFRPGRDDDAQESHQRMRPPLRSHVADQRHPVAADLSQSGSRRIAHAPNQRLDAATRFGDRQQPSRTERRLLESLPVQGRHAGHAETRPVERVRPSAFAEERRPEPRQAELQRAAREAAQAVFDEHNAMLLQLVGGIPSQDQRSSFEGRDQRLQRLARAQEADDAVQVAARDQALQVIQELIDE
jgi:hypothetical protein